MRTVLGRDKSPRNDSALTFWENARNGLSEFRLQSVGKTSDTQIRRPEDQLIERWFGEERLSKSADHEMVEPGSAHGLPD